MLLCLSNQLLCLQKPVTMSKFPRFLEKSKKKFLTDLLQVMKIIWGKKHPK